jgi:uncharacterized protein (DUF433 family)
MTLPLAAELPPLILDSSGVLRVGRTRVTLDSVVGAFQDGASAEQIAEQYPVLSLAEVYAAITYYLGHRDDVERYLAARAEQAATVRQANERVFGADGIRARLLASGAERGHP